MLPYGNCEVNKEMRPRGNKKLVIVNSMKKVTHDSLWQDILKNIRSKLAEPGVTQSMIAEKLGVDRATINRWLKGLRKASRSNPEVIVGYMRALDMNPGEYFSEDQQDTGFISVPWLHATASMGGGSYEGSREVRSHLSFQAGWLMSKGNPLSMVVISASGGSMEPTIPDGSVVLIDESKKHDLVDGKIYFVCHDSSLFLKRIRLNERGRPIELLSDRGDTPINLDNGDYFEIIGRAVWYGKDI